MDEWTGLLRKTIMMGCGQLHWAKRTAFRLFNKKRRKSDYADIWFVYPHTEDRGETYCPETTTWRAAVREPAGSGGRQLGRTEI